MAAASTEHAMCVPALLPTSAACTSLWPVAATERRSASRCGGGCAAPRSAVTSVHQLHAAQPRHPEGERHAAMRRQCQIGARLRPRRDDRAAAGLGRRPVGLQHLAGLGGGGREAHEGWAHRRRIRTKKVARSVHASDANSTHRRTDRHGFIGPQSWVPQEPCKLAIACLLGGHQNLVKFAIF